ncbi:hypothetical protein MMC29_000434 [Sticta canariensis]|nr:hypothetical protein [Sticta canariensis]
MAGLKSKALKENTMASVDPRSLKSGKANDDGSSGAPYRPLSSWRLAIVTFSLCLATFLLAIDVNMVSVAVPEISTVFHSLDDVAWYGAAYLLTVTAFQPVMGFFYKYFDVRITYLISILVFEAGSIMCAAAANSPTFIGGRAIAGLGAAGLLQGALGIIGVVVKLEKRPMFMGIVLGVFAVSGCIGPVMGGALTENLSWRWCFWILDESPDKNRNLPLRTKVGRMDIIGIVLFLGAMCCLIFALQQGGQTEPWNSSKIIGLLVGFGILLLAFSFVQWTREENALIPLRILRQRSVLMGNFYLFFIGVLTGVFGFYLPFYFQAVQGVSATISGVRMIPRILPQIFALVLASAVVTRWGYYVPYMILGSIICIIGSGLTTQVGIDTPTVAWASFLAVTGIGIGMGMQQPYTAIQVVLSESDAPTGNAISVFCSTLGSVVAIPIGQALLLSSLRTEIPLHTSSISAADIIKAGASDLQSLPVLPQTLRTLREAYAVALRGVFVFALAASCMALLFTFGMEWRNVRSEAQERKIQDKKEPKERAVEIC